MHRAQRFPYREAGASALRGLLPLARSLAVETAIEQRLDVNRKEDARHLPPWFPPAKSLQTISSIINLAVRCVGLSQSQTASNPRPPVFTSLSNWLVRGAFPIGAGAGDVEQLIFPQKSKRR